MQKGLPKDCPEAKDMPWTHPYRGSRNHQICLGRLLLLLKQPRLVGTEDLQSGLFRNE